MTRRDWMHGLAAIPAAASLSAAADIPETVISSGNGLRACAKAVEMMAAGKDTLDAVVDGVNIVEEDPEDNSVGYGGLPNEEGVVELDACVMHGPSRRCGSVASIRGIKTPSKIAKLVMEETDHIMIVGDGALRFAKTMGFPEENLLTEKSRMAWLMWKRSLRDAGNHNNWTDGLDAPDAKTAELERWRREFPNVTAEQLAWAREVVRRPITGTINCLALNRRGEMSGVTTTSGLSWKIPGRVGDSPILGAGLWVDQDVGAAGSTGRGEENIRVAGGHTIVENMRHGMAPKDAILDALKRVSRNFNDNKSKLAQFDINFYALKKDGTFAGGSLWDAHLSGEKKVRNRYSVSQGGKTRLEDCVYLYQRA